MPMEQMGEEIGFEVDGERHMAENPGQGVETSEGMVVRGSAAVKLQADEVFGKDRGSLTRRVPIRRLNNEFRPRFRRREEQTVRARSSASRFSEDCITIIAGQHDLMNPKIRDRRGFWQIQHSCAGQLVNIAAGYFILAKLREQTPQQGRLSFSTIFHALLPISAEYKSF